MPKSISWQNHCGEILDSVAGFDIIECRTCGFRHITPIPTPEELEKVYREDYYSTEKPLYLERHREDLEWWNLVYGERYDLFEQLLPSVRRRIVDVGSGPGFFLLQGKERGWDALGIEPSSQSAAHSRELGLEIVEEFLDDTLVTQLGTFDVVHLSQVLEHIPHPHDMVKRAHGLLAPGGLLCVIVPNDYSPFQHALRTACGFQPWWVAPPHHINFFDFASLKQLLERCGFEVLHQETTFPIDLFLLMGDNYIGNDDLGRACHGRRKNFELNLAKAGLGQVKQQLYQALAGLGLGREVVLIGRKR
ncbi:MAG: class I SAM-dependent methyltransferase [Deltaproteobacteria bacterium]|nr:class I SAM-dependent methyltransferase [Deltaproteobacteria bacterium]